MCMCMSVKRYVHACRCLRRPEVSDFLKMELQAIVSHTTWAQELNSGPLEEQCVFLTTKPYLLPLRDKFLYSDLLLF